MNYHENLKGIILNKIYKYKINCVHDLPYNCNILYAGEQNNKIYIWVDIGVCDNTGITDKFTFFYRFTGQEFNSDNSKYISTIQHSNGLVYHIFYSRESQWQK